MRGAADSLQEWRLSWLCTRCADSTWLGFYGPYWAASKHYSVECARAYFGFVEHASADAIDARPVDGNIVTQGATPAAAAWNGISTAERNAIEALGMTRAREYFEHRGWQVFDVSANSPYDLHCTRRYGTERHVEVKATTTTGERVLVTRNEVEHAKDSGRAVLAVLCDVELQGEPQTPMATGGRLLVIDPWVPEPQALTPISFSYTVPVLHEHI
jgi:Domain of unknown function (DUF3883)